MATAEDQVLMYKTMKETMDLEREFQSMRNENQILKQKLYQSQITLKISEMKSVLGDEYDQKKRQGAQFVEQVADFIFKI